MPLSDSQKWMLSALAIFGAAAVFGDDVDGSEHTAEVLAPPVTPLRIRTDQMGDGHYGASRTDHVHNGVDLETTAGEVVRSPVDGTVARFFKVYEDSNRWTGVELKTSVGYRIKLMYVAPKAALGSAVQIGDALGTAQPIHERYGAAMHDHIHVEVFTPAGTRIDPTPLFGL